MTPMLSKRAPMKYPLAMKNSGTAQRDSRPAVIDTSPPSVAVWMHTTAMKAHQRNRSMPACRDRPRGGSA